MLHQRTFSQTKWILDGVNIVFILQYLFVDGSILIIVNWLVISLLSSILPSSSKISGQVLILISLKNEREFIQSIPLIALELYLAYLQFLLHELEVRNFNHKHALKNLIFIKANSFFAKRSNRTLIKCCIIIIMNSGANKRKVAVCTISVTTAESDTHGRNVTHCLQYSFSI